MSASGSATTCALDGCAREAVSELRFRPRRTTTPLTTAIRRALAWPGSADPVSVACCKEHRKAVRDAAHVILAESPLGEDVAAVLVKDSAP